MDGKTRSQQALLARQQGERGRDNSYPAGLRKASGMRTGTGQLVPSSLGKHAVKTYTGKTYLAGFHAVKLNLYAVGLGNKYAVKKYNENEDINMLCFLIHTIEKLSSSWIHNRKGNAMPRC